MAQNESKPLLDVHGFIMSRPRPGFPPGVEALGKAGSVALFYGGC